ncbi:hypothetical protein Ssed_0850 [Shewanella sediminis HAW-EB3]|uniref:Outer membrane lipoprotein n=1 Tax=Shewanella sediminis (strain HAW-EB3) TaxID=425104 RepID=A8FRI8_SHESH|nr:hypothetical protein [Shewanella sediminis]ABV35461.1 hypothetical protein Ssed_0850 [Shewanella sediminis HAW-EB3]
MKKLLIAALLSMTSLSALAETIYITAVEHIDLGSSSAGSGAMIGGVTGAVAGDSWGDIAVGVIGGAIVGDVVSDSRDGVKISIEYLDGRQRVVIQDGNIKNFRLGTAELEEIHHGSSVKLEIRPNRR